MTAQTRTLRPTTIIPEHLYVRRSADRQLDQIINDMGRPGYVLVSRQMGKTNLLLSMKRRRESAGDLVVYIDLSERFDSARACFRNIVDVAAELNPTLLKAVYEEILAERDNSELEPSLEYGRHLRKIVNAISGSLIIVFDEVDSLINVEFGDTILSQVRSTYFTRINFQEYSRITYVLSGVAEPTDLIKDRNISPFNIGEKIYLDDFSRAEVLEFIEKSGLPLSGDVVDRIIDWSGGNPRITWDICSSLETQLSDGSIDASKVDETVEQLYLSGFGRPPVDHIRDLVSSEPPLRNALISMRYGKGSTIDERTRTRLYLAGITKAPGGEPLVKNRIIDAALSDSWLAQAAPGGIDPLTNASEHFAGRRYKQAAELFKVVAASEALAPNSRVQLGISLYNIGEYGEAAQELEQASRELSGEMLTTALYYAGSAELLADRAVESISFLNRAATEGTGPYKIPSHLLLAAAFYRAPKPEHRGEGEALKDELLDTLRGFTRDELEKNAEAFTASLYTVALAAMAASDPGAAEDYLAFARTIAPPHMLPNIIISQAAVATSQEDQDRYAREAVNAALDGDLKISPDEQTAIAFSERTIAALLSSMAALDDAKLKNKLISNLPRFFQESRSPGQILLGLSQILSDTGQENVAKILGFIAERNLKEELDKASELTYYRLVAIHGSEEDQESARSSYLEILRGEYEPGSLKEEDIVFLVTLVQQWTNAGRQNEAISLIRLALPYVRASASQIWVLILLFFEVNILNGRNDLVEAQRSAQKMLDLCNINDFSEEGAEIANLVKTMVETAHRTLKPRPFLGPDPFRQIGRNQKVTVAAEGATSERTVKFKVVEHELRQGKLKLVRIHPR